MDKNQNPTVYTGDIVAEKIDPTREYTTENQEIVFTGEQHAIWADLYAGIHQPYLLEHLCYEHRHGMELLELDPYHIPTVAHLNSRITPRTGLRIERTAVRYTLADDWYRKFSQRARVDDKADMAAVAAVSAVGPAEGDELLAAEGEAASAAVAGFRLDSDFVNELYKNPEDRIQDPEFRMTTLRRTAAFH